MHEFCMARNAVLKPEAVRRLRESRPFSLSPGARKSEERMPWNELDGQEMPTNALKSLLNFSRGWQPELRSESQQVEDTTFLDWHKCLGMRVIDSSRCSACGRPEAVTEAASNWNCSRQQFAAEILGCPKKVTRKRRSAWWEIYIVAIGRSLRGCS